MTGSSSFTKFDQEVSIRYSAVSSDVLGSDYYYTTEPFTYHIDCFPSNKTVTVPAAFLTDGASIPRAFWFWASPIGRHAQAAILHDYLCEYLTILVDGNPTRITRKEADLIFKESLLVLGVGTVKANMMYAGVAAYRKITGVDSPSVSLDKIRLEEELFAKLVDKKCGQDEVCRINTRRFKM